MSVIDIFERKEYELEVEKIRLRIAVKIINYYDILEENNFNVTDEVFNLLDKKREACAKVIEKSSAYYRYKSRDIVKEESILKDICIDVFGRDIPVEFVYNTAFIWVFGEGDTDWLEQFKTKEEDDEV